jgi:peptide deformylase
MVHPIVVYGDPVLRQRAREIGKGTDVSVLIADLFDTMHAAKGIGLAAPQIGRSVRAFVVDGSGLEDEKDMHDFRKVFLNPVMLEELGSPWEFEEGCLSIPNIREKVSRKATLRIRYFDESWVAQEEEFGGMKARIIQHEYDHIEGRLFIDYLTSLKKRLLKGKLADISKGEVDTEYPIKAPVRKV